jgi:molybdenum cofactor cytidylyltransferase
VSAPVSRVAAIVLAAGEASRYGGQKLLAPLRGKPLLQHALDAANASRLEPVVVVLGADADKITRAIDVGRARIVRNAEYASGQASSLRAGVHAVEDADAVIVLLGDQPLVTAALLDALVARQRETGAAAVICAQDGRRSPPTLLGAEFFPLIDALRGDVGAREILARRSDVVTLDVAPAIARLDDIDTRADLDRLVP